MFDDFCKAFEAKLEEMAGSLAAIKIQINDLRDDLRNAHGQSNANDNDDSQSAESVHSGPTGLVSFVLFNK
jgi:predicted phage tail protein